MTLIFGWSLEQYQKASEYRSLFTDDSSASVDDFVAAACGDQLATRRLLAVKTFWMQRRIDAPGEIKILATEWKPTNYGRTNAP